MNNIDLVLEAINTLQPLFEVGGPEEVPPSENKISRKRKDKDGETKEVVSVADELFPKEGNAKQQFNQKVIDKINDMIQGTATLEDLIQLVSRKQAAKKQVHEGLDELSEKISIVEEIINEVSIGLFKAAAKSSAPKRREAVQAARANKSIPYEERMRLHKRAVKAGDAVIGTTDYEETDKTPAREVIKKASKELPELKKKSEENPRDWKNLSNYVEAKKLAKFDKSESLDEKINIVESTINELYNTTVSNASMERMKRRAANPNSREAEAKMDKNAGLVFIRSLRQGTFKQDNQNPIGKAMLRHGRNVHYEKIFPKDQKAEDRTVESGRILKKIGRVANDLEKHGNKGQNVGSKIKTIVRKGMKKVDALEECFEELNSKLLILEEMINEVSRKHKVDKFEKYRKSTENERELVDTLKDSDVPKQFVHDLETDVIRKEHKIYPKLAKLEQETIDNIKKNNN